MAKIRKGDFYISCRFFRTFSCLKGQFMSLRGEKRGGVLGKKGEKGGKSRNRVGTCIVFLSLLFLSIFWA